MNFGFRPPHRSVFRGSEVLGFVISSLLSEGRRESEKRRRGVVTEGLEMNDEIGSLNLNLGGQVYPINEGEETSGKKTKMIVSTTSNPTSNRAVCQVEDCRADLSNAKDYHRRHKVCDLHSKASKALVANVMQRFCQQCSRFHVLQEFDEGKRSCRRRLAGHNKRRRKTHPDAAVVNGGSLNEERGNSYLLMSLLRILSNMHAADVFLWKNKKVSAGAVGGATAVWVFFELFEYHFLTLICHISILLLALLFLWSNAHTFVHKRQLMLMKALIPHCWQMIVPVRPF